ncbi:hypothetical protein IQ277_04570 [Nostocales cyanobacterium LEGE 12452]|nr:hypothetical protein [Nostocales cyanobacterium LEGE 12452]
MIAFGGCFAPSRSVLETVKLSSLSLQKSKELYSKLLRRLKWYVYLRHAVLVRSLVPEIRCKSDLIFEKITYS